MLTTLPLELDADSFARTLVHERLAACVSVLPPMSSTYRWQGKVESATERQALLKTTAGRVDALMQRISELHPYEVPELLVARMDGGGADYLAWLSEEVRADETERPG